MAAELCLDLSEMNPKQLKFFKCKKKFVGYGGARGGGKSWTVRHKAVLLALNYPGIKMLLLRRTFPELQENHINELRKMLNGFAKYTEGRKIFEFPNGSTLKLGYCANESDTLQYQGVEYDVIFMDEATQFTFKQFSDLTACVRGTNNFPKRMYLTCNPGGVGHEWVKRLFITKKYENSEKAEDYEFIAATVFDNKVMLRHNPEYVDMLNNLPEDIRAAWRDGNWDMLAGRYFEEFDRGVHVVEPFSIPEHYVKYRGIDYGLDCAACVWVAIDENGDYIVYREYAEENKTISEAASDIVSLSEGENIRYTVAPTDLWSRSQESAKAKADLFRENGLPLIKGSNNREAGWLAIKDLLKISGNGEMRHSRIKIFSSCEKLIEYLPALQRDSRHPTDCMTEPHYITHIPDALRYFCLQYVSPSKSADRKQNEAEKIKRDAIYGSRRNSKRYW